MTVMIVIKGTDGEVLEAALPDVEEASTPEPEVGVTPGIALIEVLDSKRAVEEPRASEDGSTGDDAPDDKGVAMPEDPDTSLDPGAGDPVD